MFYDLDGILGGGLVVYVLLRSGEDVAGLCELGQCGHRSHCFCKIVFFLNFSCRALILLNGAWLVGLGFNRLLFWLLSLYHLT